MKIKSFLFTVFSTALCLSGCRSEQAGQPDGPRVYRRVAVSVGQADEGRETRSIVSIDIENFQKAALFAFDSETGKLLLRTGSRAGRGTPHRRRDSDAAL